MARKVFVSSDISHDEKLLEVAERDPTAALLWPWLLTVFDDWGRARADARRLKVQVFPGNDLVTTEVISRTLALFREVALITAYEVGGTAYMAVDPDVWFRWQTHIRKDKREDDSGSSCPPPPDTERKPSSAASNGGTNREDARSLAGSREKPRDRAPSPSPSPSLSPPPSAPPTPPRLAEEWARRWCDIRGINATRAVLRSLVPRVAEYIEDAGEPTEDLLNRAHEMGIKVPGGWGYAAAREAGTMTDDEWNAIVKGQD